MHNRILAALKKPNYSPCKPKALARKIGISDGEYSDFRAALKDLQRRGQIEFGRNHAVMTATSAGKSAGVLGVFRRATTGRGFVRPQPVDGTIAADIAVRDGGERDAVTGDLVLVKIVRPTRQRDETAVGEIVRVVERATRQFVGTYFERDGEGLVRVDGHVFAHSVAVGDPGAKGVRPDDKVVIEMLRFPTPDDRGEAVIAEVLGPRGDPGVDTLSVVRAYGIPDEFPADVLDEARAQAAKFRENDLAGREDFTGELVVTIDPADARDHDDAISLKIDHKSKHWLLGVHIADVAHFAPAGSALDREARNRGTSVYLPRHVVPMFPEVISNGLASLHEGKVRYAKSAVIEYTASGQRVGVRFANSAIRVSKRFTYDQVSSVLSAEEPPADVKPDVARLLKRMRDLAMKLRERRRKRGSLELAMPEAVLDYDADGRVSGAHYAVHDVSHQIIEEFMLAANVAVAEHFHELDAPFLRRVHPPPDKLKLEAFAKFARGLGYKLDYATDRFSLQRILEESAGKPDARAVHFALLRSLKQASYSPLQEEHFALASPNYCHFTSPIRRYPDLTVHRLLDRWLRTGKATGDLTEMTALGEHCSKTERRAEAAERELVKVKLLTYFSGRVGAVLDAVITGVAEYGFFAQGVEIPVEGRVHVSTLTDDYYTYDDESHTLQSRRTKTRYRLGDAVRVEVVRVDLGRRQLDFRVADRAVKVERGKKRGAK